jgi:hypothetical protein
MIIRPADGGDLLITQPDHAALAGRIMEAWRADGLDENPRREAILLAVREHDNGWAEPDATPMLGADGKVLDFMTAPDALKRAVWPRAIANLARHHYAAALVAQHALHVYRRYRDNAGWADFFTAMETARRAYMGLSGVGLETLMLDYRFVRIGDLLSLTFCNAWTDEQRDDTGTEYRAVLAGDRLLITPDPFAGLEVPLEIEGRTTADGAPRRVTVRGVATGQQRQGPG